MAFLDVGGAVVMGLPITKWEQQMAVRCNKNTNMEHQHSDLESAVPEMTASSSAFAAPRARASYKAVSSGKSQFDSHMQAKQGLPGICFEQPYTTDSDNFVCADPYGTDVQPEKTDKSESLGFCVADSCKPCLFMHKGLCNHGSECRFCHLRHSARRIRKARPSKITRMQLKNRIKQMQENTESETEALVANEAKLT
mmetsp:Transcript_108351/g.209758  ORF Transcript_108351/g.209758 Transcript_108351/m.209758 type:complete len:197 (-) Transcript_108351:56-646(-)